MKKIGVIAVCVGGTLLFYPDFVRKAILKLNKNNPDVYIHQLPLSQVNHAFEQLTSGNPNKLADLILHSIDELIPFKLDYIVVPNNAAHLVIDLVQKKSSIPIINLLDAVSEFCVENNFKRILTIGSRWIMEQGLFQKSLKRKNIETLTIENHEKLMIHDAIMEATVTGSIDKTTTRQIIQIIDRKRTESKCDAVIMACSDIVRILENYDIGLTKINTMTVLADKTLVLMIAQQ